MKNSRNDSPRRDRCSSCQSPFLNATRRRPLRTDFTVWMLMPVSSETCFADIPTYEGLNRTSSICASVYFSVPIHDQVPLRRARRYSIQ